jgi:hypothetical protein
MTSVSLAGPAKFWLVITLAVLAFLGAEQAQAQARNGATPKTLSGTIGQRQTRDQVNANEYIGRVNARLQTRVTTRLQTRIDRNYDGDPNAANQIRQAGERTRNTGP